MNVKQFMHKAFVTGDWYVGYRGKNEDKYSIIPEDPQNWIADPFLYEYDNEHYLFVEYIQNHKGTIAYYKFIDGKPVFQKIVIEESYHLSYPCVFDYDGDVYMIPESADNGTVDLYKAVDFPQRWEKIGTLLHGIYYDSTVLKNSENLYLFTYSPSKSGYTLSSYKLNIEDLSAEHLADKLYKKNIGRPAGNFMFKDGSLIRPAQDCRVMYGEKILLNSITEYGTKIEESIIDEIDVGNNTEFQRIHTFNSDMRYEVVDFLKERVSLIRPLKLIIKVGKQKLAVNK